MSGPPYPRFEAGHDLMRRLYRETKMRDGTPAETWVLIRVDELPALATVAGIMDRIALDPERIMNAYDARYTVELSWAEKQRLKRQGAST